MSTPLATRPTLQAFRLDRPTTYPNALLALLLLIVSLFGCRFLRLPTGAPLQGDEARVIRVVDGDTIEVVLWGRSETVRYIGIDTPERGQPGYRAATEANRSLVGGKTVYLRQDQTDRDSFGRLLRYIFLEDGTLVNAQLVANGWAQPVEYSRDRARAVEANVPVATIPLGEVGGVQLAEPTPAPSATRTTSAKCPEGCLTPPEPVCNIKGNINSSGGRIYHLPGGALYNRTTINTDEGDRWFCTTKEAESAGFRAALR